MTPEQAFDSPREREGIDAILGWLIHVKLVAPRRPPRGAGTNEEKESDASDGSDASDSFSR
ncbi:MAG TPA: hypothetical protein VFZ11_07060 [Gemmatimonadaceae bacterium]